MFRMWPKICLIILVICVMQANVSTANAMLSEAASLAISTAGGMLQEDDKKLEQEIIKDLSDDEQKQKLKKHIEETRPIIKDKSKFFNGVISPAFVWFMQKSPSFGNMIMGTVTSAYIMHYKSSLEDDADSDVLRKFEELREHNIDAGQGIFETLMDAMEPKYDNDTSSAVLITDGALLAAKGKQNYDRYTSSAAAIANVLEAAGIAMQSEDVGDICGNHIAENKQNKSNKSVNIDSVNNDSSDKANHISNAQVGNIRLGDTMISVNNKLGEPRKKTNKNGGEIDCEYAAMDVSYINNKTIGIAVDDKNITTPQGIHAGSSLQDVLNKYGTGYMLSQYNNLDLYEYEYTDDNSKKYYLRFAVKQDSGIVKYISIRYVD